MKIDKLYFRDMKRGELYCAKGSFWQIFLVLRNKKACVSNEVPFEIGNIEIFIFNQNNYKEITTISYQHNSGLNDVDNEIFYEKLC